MNNPTKEQTQNAIASAVLAAELLAIYLWFSFGDKESKLPLIFPRIGAIYAAKVTEESIEALGASGMITPEQKDKRKSIATCFKNFQYVALAFSVAYFFLLVLEETNKRLNNEATSAPSSTPKFKMF